ncbi:MAG: hypothetical protein K6E49_01820 [Lachnospiraceae bacterium]|nr:hypothetical protein [Lachnospiraceae bacterium]
MSISRLFVSRKNETHIRSLYPGSESDRRIRIFGKEKACIFAVIMTLTMIISIPVFVADHNRLSRPVGSLRRNEFGEGVRSVTLKARSSNGYEEKLRVDVEERMYTEQEISEFSKKLDDVLWKEILGDNEDPENVMYDLDLKRSIYGYPFDITWKSDKPLILSSKGVINTDRLSEEDPEDKGMEIRLTASLKYRDHSEDKYSYVILRKRKKGPEEDAKELIEESVKKANELTKTGSDQILPDHVEGYSVRFYDASFNRGWAAVFFGLAAAMLIMTAKDRKIEDEARKRREQMDRDHPGILNQYILYYMAGMNPRAIWTNICKRYEESLKIPGSSRRYAYDEMQTALKKMDEGCSELRAYDEFAQRCDNVRYRSFISFVKQAVEKGNDGLYEILYEEMDKAQREKNNRIKMEASEAETKLLLPMFMMLAVVLVVVMVPAFIGLNS